MSTLPVSTAEAERLFSKVPGTLSALRSSMNKDRLEALVLIQTHRDDLPSYEDVFNRFMQSRRHVSLQLIRLRRQASYNTSLRFVIGSTPGNS